MQAAPAEVSRDRGLWVTLVKLHVSLVNTEWPQSGQVAAIGASCSIVASNEPRRGFMTWGPLTLESTLSLNSHVLSRPQGHNCKRPV